MFNFNISRYFEFIISDSRYPSIRWVGVSKLSLSEKRDKRRTRYSWPPAESEYHRVEFLFDEADPNSVILLGFLQ